MNLYEKLLIIQQKVNRLSKDEKSFGYDYVSGTKVLSFIKPLMNELGLLLKQEVIDSTNTEIKYTTSKGVHKHEILTELKLRFTWIDAKTGEKDENLFGANGQNDFEKGYGSALTYGERYFLLKFFHIATDEDDVDNPNRKPNHEIAPPPQQPKQKEILNDSHPKWQGAIDALKAKTTTIDAIKKKYDLSTDYETILKDSIK